MLTHPPQLAGGPEAIAAGRRGLVRQDDRVHTALGELASRALGFRSDAIRASAIHQLATLLAEEAPERVIERARAGDPDLARQLARLVTVGETYFFRHPEHYDFVVREWLPAHVAKG